MTFSSFDYLELVQYLKLPSIKLFMSPSSVTVRTEDSTFFYLF